MHMNGKESNAYRILARKFEENINLGTTTWAKVEANIKLDLK
jgi:hypothetical protein